MNEEIKLLPERAESVLYFAVKNEVDQLPMSVQHHMLVVLGAAHIPLVECICEIIRKREDIEERQCRTEFAGLEMKIACMDAAEAINRMNVALRDIPPGPPKQVHRYSRKKRYTVNKFF